LDGWGFASRVPEKSSISEKRMPFPQELWDGVLRRLAGDLPAFALEAWLRPLAAESGDEGVRLLCPTPFHLERVRERYQALIARRLCEQAGREIPVSLALSAARPSAEAVGHRERPAAGAWG
jgi:chromosomal replication initiator protein